MKMLSDDDLDLKALNDDEHARVWDLWFDLAQSGPARGRRGGCRMPGIEERVLCPEAGDDSGPVRAPILEIVEGDTLADRISRGPVPVPEALTIAGQIADALQGAHAGCQS